MKKILLISVCCAFGLTMGLGSALAEETNSSCGPGTSDKVDTSSESAPVKTVEESKTPAGAAKGETAAPAPKPKKP